MSKANRPVISKKDLPAPTRKHRYYTPDEVKLHNSANDCYVSIFHEVYDLTRFIQENYSPLMEPIIKAAGTDISHWFDPKLVILKHIYYQVQVFYLIILQMVYILIYLHHFQIQNGFIISIFLGGKIRIIKLEN